MESWAPNNMVSDPLIHGNLSTGKAWEGTGDLSGGLRLGCGIPPGDAHNLFDELSSRYGVSEEDVLCVMNEERLSTDEAIYLLLAEFKLMEAHRRFDEKLDRLLEMFGAKEAKNEAYENKEGELYPDIRMTTTDFKSTSSSSPQPLLLQCSPTVR
uniref:Uncharacterized protein n=1 Tax=Leersia perrieri TaxID=77586 RepID=A0A0D9XUQ5_9ORYZ